MECKMRTFGKASIEEPKNYTPFPHHAYEVFERDQSIYNLFDLRSAVQVQSKVTFLMMVIDFYSVLI